MLFAFVNNSLRHLVPSSVISFLICQWPSSMIGYHQSTVFIRYRPTKSAAFISQWFSLASWFSSSQQPSSVIDLCHWTMPSLVLKSLHHSTTFVSQQPSSSSSLRLSATFVLSQPSSFSNLRHSAACIRWQPSSFNNLRHSTFFICQQPSNQRSHQQSTFDI